MSLTILTKPVSINTRIKMCTSLGIFPHKLFWGGPNSVVRSLKNGFKRLGVKYNVNPLLESSVADSVIVLSNIDALKQAIEWKRKGKIKKLFAGPNLVVRSNEFNNILGSKEIDVCIVPSQWVKKAYLEDLPVLKNRIAVWAAGVDEKYWSQRSAGDNSRKVLVYWKTERQSFVEEVEHILKKNSWSPVRIIYNSYKQENFKKNLSECKFAVFVSRSESQGIALLEAWAMDIPTLVWDPGQLCARGKVYNQVSSCPYLNNKLGLRWKTIEEFENMVVQFLTGFYKFRPRKWILENMTDKISARKLLSIIMWEN